MSVKKAELHVHLEGTITPAMAKKLAERNNLSYPKAFISTNEDSYCFQDFMHFLHVYDVIADLIKTPTDYYDITFDYLRANALTDTLYVEMMYSPDHAEKASGMPSIEHLYAIQQAIDDAKAQYGIIGRIIVTAVRHFGAEAAVRVAQQIAKQSVPCVTGFGLGGDEANFPPKLFTKAYNIAAEQGLSCTIHAGEFAPASGMVEAMENLPIQRIGHGVHSRHSPETIAMVKDRDIALELCPSSGITLGIFNNIHEHPLPLFLDAGLKISINSDDPPFMNTTVAKEYALVQDTFHYTDEVMNHITAMAIDCAFVDNPTKDELRAKLAQ